MLPSPLSFEHAAWRFGLHTKKLTTRLLAARFDIGVFGVAVAGALAIAVLISAPDAHISRMAAIALTAVAVALLAPPNVFLLGSFLFFATLQLVADTSFSIGPATFYVSDLFLGLVVVRAFGPHSRAAPRRNLGGLTLFAFAVWAAMMLFGIGRGLENGAPFDVIFRYSMALFYWPILYFGFSRVLREKCADTSRVLHGIVAIGLGLVAYMFLMRALHRPFEPEEWQGGTLGGVMSNSGETYHRDYGFYSAYIVYPMLAVVAVGKLLYDRTRQQMWLFIALIGIIATLSTLMRSKNYGLLAGIAVLVLLSRAPSLRRRVYGQTLSRRLSVVLTIVAVIAIAAAALAIVSPGFAHVTGERSIPYLFRESQGARDNAKFRSDAFAVGVRIANENVTGVGVLSPEQLKIYGVQPGYFVDSGFPRLLVFLGWPGLVAVGLILLGLIFDSARQRSREPWLHPVLVAFVVVLVADSMGNSSIFGNAYVIGTAALLVALRFAAASPPAPALGMATGQASARPARLLPTRP
jgi:hypothetical protein